MRKKKNVQCSISNDQCSRKERYFRNREAVGEIEAESLWRADFVNGVMVLVDDDQFVTTAEYEGFYAVEEPDMNH